MDENFHIAYSETIKNEGLLSNNKDDLGGLTWKGIAYNMHPGWKGWPIVKSSIEEGMKATTIAKNVTLEKMVQEFYYNEFWLRVGGDRIKDIRVSKKIFDTAVNMGCFIAIRFAEKSVSLPETGKVSEKLIDRLNQVV